MLRLRMLLALAALGLSACSTAAAPLTFEFAPPPEAAIKNPFARELWGEVITPSGRTLLLPAYYAGQQVYAVRARPDETGTYRLARVLESSFGRAPAEVTPVLRNPGTLENTRASRLPAIGIHPQDSTRFARADGKVFLPIGTNLAWARSGDPVAFYREALPRFAAAHLTWMRVWMAHWGRTNLDWLHPDDGPSPPPGGIDLHVAERWDRILESAEEHGVYIQLVFQHHGQFSTTVNPNWADHPWNAANPGGFLHSPGEFFTDPNARALTALKYRYIVARWGWSPAIFAWELFNEVHWVDAFKLNRNEAAVAAWHTAMANYLRSIDAYRHLVTTSTEDLRSPIFAAMDFLQPHLYPVNLFGGVRTFASRPPGDTRPFFYGEFGDDHLSLSPEVKASGLAEIAPVWASVMSESRLPAQPWEGWRLLEHDKLGELGAVHRFYATSGLARFPTAEPFSPSVASASQSPLHLVATQHWQRRPGADFTLPLDGSEPAGLGDWPATFVTPESEANDGFPSSSRFRADFPTDTTLRFHVDQVGATGGNLRIEIDGHAVVERTWPPGAVLPVEIAVPAAAGPREIVVKNPGGADWVRIPHLDLGVLASDLVAVGRRDPRFIALWIRHRRNILAASPGPAAQGEIVLSDMPAGTWIVKWWDTATGQPGSPASLSHPGGELRVPTPEILRHAAVTLTLDPASASR